MAKALAGGDNLRLQELIPLILQHNGLPAVNIPSSALTVDTRTRLPRRGHPGAKGKTEASLVAVSTTQDQAAAAEAEPTGDRPGTREEIHENVVGEGD
ncbi:hypothetical protein E2C01_026619 [Portunus trituberculatus]|uniref:Uncharacterized protein n=1 Tax=Portunus trituberculatus TaxID=210409 RepID=A0A5B7ELG6_PORTR|nr:hypothetical protein [Portunus trituberculatus]